MVDIEKNSIKYLIILITSISIAGIIIWPLFDWLICIIFTHSAFVYSVTDHIIEPIIFGCIIGLTLWAIEKKSSSKSHN